MKTSIQRLLIGSSRIARWAGWIAFASLLPATYKPHVSSADKVEHFVAYLIAGGLLTFGWRVHADVSSA